MKKYQFLSCVFFLFITLTNAQVKTKFNNNEFITTKGIFQKNYKESVLHNTPKKQKNKAKHHLAQLKELGYEVELKQKK